MPDHTWTVSCSVAPPPGTDWWHKCKKMIKCKLSVQYVRFISVIVKTVCTRKAGDDTIFWWAGIKYNCKNCVIKIKSQVEELCTNTALHSVFNNQEILVTCTFHEDPSKVSFTFQTYWINIEKARNCSREEITEFSFVLCSNRRPWNKIVAAQAALPLLKPAESVLLHCRKDFHFTMPESPLDVQGEWH